MRAIREKLKLAALHGAKSLGLFGIAPRLTIDRLRILCYHSISLKDEHLLSPGTFMQPSTFRRRMEILSDWGATVLPLDDALALLRKKCLPEKAVVITIDDGWYGTYSLMVPVLKEFNYPATLYACTYYMMKQTFVFPPFLQYLLFQAGDVEFDLSRVDKRLAGIYRLSDRTEMNAAAARLVDYGETALDSSLRDALCLKLADYCGYDANEAAERRMFKLMNMQELSELNKTGIDVQLHTHRHVFSTNSRRLAEIEVEENRQVLAEFGIGPSRHFCYPNGDYTAEHPAWLEALGIDSAVTTDFGLASASMSPYLLPRICDSNMMSELDFEAAVCGFKTVAARN